MDLYAMDIGDDIHDDEGNALSFAMTLTDADSAQAVIMTVLEKAATYREERNSWGDYLQVCALYFEEEEEYNA